MNAWLSFWLGFSLCIDPWTLCNSTLVRWRKTLHIIDILSQSPLFSCAAIAARGGTRLLDHSTSCLSQTRPWKISPFQFRGAARALARVTCRVHDRERRASEREVGILARCARRSPTHRVEELDGNVDGGGLTSDRH